MEIPKDMPSETLTCITIAIDDPCNCINVNMLTTRYHHVLKKKELKIISPFYFITVLHFYI